MSHYDELDSIIEDTVLYAISAALTHKGYNVTAGDPPTEWRNHISKITRSGNSYTIERTLNTQEAAGDQALEGVLEDQMERFKTEIFDHYPAVIPPLFDDWRGVELLSDLVAERETLHDALTWINITPGSAQAGGGAGGFAGGEISRPLGDLDWRAGELRGRAAEAFYSGYVSRVDEAVGNNAVLMSGLEIAMVAQYEVIKGVREDVGEIAVAARGAMKAAGALDTTDDTTVGIAVLGALAAAVGIVASGGLAAAASGVAAGAGLLNSLRGATKKQKDVTVSGDHPDDVVSDLETELTNYADDVRQSEQDIVDELDRLAATAAGQGDSGEAQPDFDLGSPKLLDSRDASNVLDERSDPSDIRFTFDSVDKIANSIVPAIGDCLDEARRGLDVSSAPFTRPWTVGLGSTGIYSSYSALQDEVVGNLTSLKKNLTRAGETLQVAVQHIGTTDEAVDERLGRRADRIDEIDAAQLREQRERERQEQNRPPHILPPRGQPFPA